MEFSYKKSQKIDKSPFYPEEEMKKHQRILSEKEMDLKDLNIIPYYRNNDYNFGHSHYETQYEYPNNNFYSIDDYYSNYNDFDRIRPPSKELLKTENPKKYTSYSQEKNFNDYNNLNKLYNKSFIENPKHLFDKQDEYYNEYNLGNNYLKGDYNTPYYRNVSPDQYTKKRPMINYTIDVDNNISNNNNSNYDYTNYTTALNTHDNDKFKGKFNHYIINTNNNNYNYNYNNNNSNFNTFNDDYLNYNDMELNTFETNGKNKINNEPYTLNPSNYFYNYFVNKYNHYDDENNEELNQDKNNKIQYFSQKNIKNKYHSERKHMYKNKKEKDKDKEKKELLKRTIEVNEPSLDKDYKYSKSQKKNNFSYKEIKIQNKIFSDRNSKKNNINYNAYNDNNNYIENNPKTIVTEPRERKNKIKIISSIKPAYNIKTIYTSKLMSHEHSRDNINKNTIHTIKTIKRNNFALIKKNNYNLMKRYHINNNTLFISKNNHSKKETIHSKKKNNKNLTNATKKLNINNTSNININNNITNIKINNTITNINNSRNNKSLINNTKIKIIVSKYKINKKNKPLENHKEAKSPPIIVNKPKILIPTKNLNTNRLFKKKNIIKIKLNDNAIKNKKKLNTRKHKCKIVLSKDRKKECEICHKLIDSHLFKIHYNSHPTKIFDWLYLGTFNNACDIEELRRNKINYVLNCAIECVNTKLPPDIKELHLKVKDEQNFDIFEYFDEANDFINKCRNEGGNILIHCKYGISRSPTFIIAYLYKYNKLTIDGALRLLTQKRSQTKPNKGFLDQLYLYEKYF